MALIDDYQIEEGWREALEQAFALLIWAPQRLVDAEVEVAVQIRGMALDQVTRIAGAIGKGENVL